MAKNFLIACLFLFGCFDAFAANQPEWLNCKIGILRCRDSSECTPLSYDHIANYENGFWGKFSKDKRIVKENLLFDFSGRKIQHISLMYFNYLMSWNEIEDEPKSVIGETIEAINKEDMDGSISNNQMLYASDSVGIIIFIE